ncbi:MAG: ABC transporter permease, partial [Clostridia bacterium]|nr:ABC transporter permease [Clostridia bacterium]
TLISFVMGMIFVYYRWDKVALRAYNENSIDTVAFTQKPLGSTSVTAEYHIMTMANKELIEDSNSSFKFAPIYGRGDESWTSIRELYNYYPDYYYYRGEIQYALMDETIFSDYGFELLAGRLPTSFDEIALPLYLYESLETYGYNGRTVKDYSDIINKVLTITSYGKRLKVVGIIDTHLGEEYISLKELEYESLTLEQDREYSEFDYKLSETVSFSHHSSIFVSQQYIDVFFDGNFDININMQYDEKDYRGFNETTENKEIEYWGQTADNATKLGFGITRVVGSGALQNNEIILSKEFIEQYIKNHTGDWDVTLEDMTNYLANGMTVRVIADKYPISPEEDSPRDGYSVVGYYVLEGTAVISKVLYKEYVFVSDETVYSVGRGDERVRAMVTRLSGNKRQDLKLLRFSFKENLAENVYFGIEGRISDDIYMVKELTDFYKKIGLLASLVLGVFSLLMMFNFISFSISNMKKAIGILRAMGTKNRDVFLIFFAESLLIALIASAIAVGVSFAGAAFLNSIEIGVTIKLFYIEYNTVLTMLGLALFIATTGCALPLIKILKKKPVEIIRSA